MASSGVILSLNDVTRLGAVWLVTA